MPQEVRASALSLQGLNGVVVTGAKRVASSSAYCCGQPSRAHETHIDGNRDRVGAFVACATTGLKGVGNRGVAINRLIVVKRVGLSIRDRNMVVVGRRCRVGNRDIGSSNAVQVLGVTTITDSWVRQLRVSIPTNNHAG